MVVGVVELMISVRVMLVSSPVGGVETAPPELQPCATLVGVEVVRVVRASEEMPPEVQ